jgi:hypothetical protein
MIDEQSAMRTRPGFSPNAIASVIGLGLLGSFGTALASDPWKDSLKRVLESTYTLSKRATLSPDRITKQGTVMVVRKGGITADVSSDLRYSVTKVTDGAIGEEGGAVPGMFTKERSRIFKDGERLFVIDIDVYDDGVMLKVMTCETFDINEKGSTQQRRYKAAVKFMYPKGSGPSKQVADIKAAIDPVMVPEAEAAAVNTKTIGLGQTRSQVEEILGRPERIVDLGTKVTYVYKDMKVVFLDGKVADVQ